MVKKIDGIVISERIKDEVALGVFANKANRPNLAIILVGNRPDSKMYVSLKQRESVKVGIDTHLYSIDEDAPEKELIEVIEFLNSDPNIDGILLQLPLPASFDTDKIISIINPEKDVDGFHPNHPEHLLSPVLAAIGACLEEINFSGAGKKACVLYNSEVFGKSVKDYLVSRKFTIITEQESDEADLLVTAVGQPKKINNKMIKDGAILIDIGITLVSGKTVGDLDWDSISKKAAWATPVPGGIGPMTVAFLLKNTWEIFKRQN